MEMFNHSIAGDFKALWIMGENPVVSGPNQHHVISALKSLEFLVVQDIFLTETAQLAHVVLPTCAFLEKKGTVTNTERRVQRVRKALDGPQGDRLDWEIVCDLSSRLGYNMAYRNAEEIFEEIRQVTPQFAGITYERLLGKSSGMWKRIWG